MITLLSKLFKLDYKTLVEISSYYELYDFLIRQIFGIKFKDNLIYINPNKNHFDQNFKMIILDDIGKQHSIYINQNSDFKGLEVGDVIYSNLKVVDLNFIDHNAKLCI